MASGQLVATSANHNILQHAAISHSLALVVQPQHAHSCQTTVCERSGMRNFVHLASMFLGTKFTPPPFPSMTSLLDPHCILVIHHEHLWDFILSHPTHLGVLVNVTGRRQSPAPSITWPPAMLSYGHHNSYAKAALCHESHGFYFIPSSLTCLWSNRCVE